MFRIILPLILSTSVSVRSPNIEPNPFDYEIAFKVQKADIAYFDIEFERENGIEYLDKETWILRRFGRLSIKERYLEKESRNIKFNQIDCRYNHKQFSVGYGLKHYDSALLPSHNLVIGWQSKAINWDIIIAQLSVQSSIDVVSNFNRLDISTHNEAKFRLNTWENVSLSMLLNYERLGDKYFYQAKTTLNLEIK